MNDIILKNKKRLLRFLIIACAVLFSLYCFVLAPLYTYMCADIVFAVTALPEVLDFILDIVDIVAYAVCFSVIIYSIYKYTAKSSRKIITTVCVAMLLKYTANFTMSAIIDGSVAIEELSSVVIFFLLDMLWLTIISLAANGIIKDYKDVPAFPFSKALDMSNPLQRSAFVMSAIMGGVHIATRIVYDLFYGLPKSIIDALWMVTYYLSDVASAIVMYLLAIFLFMKLNEKDNAQAGK